MVTQVQIARHAGVDVSTVNKILNRRREPAYRKETIRRVFQIARRLGFDFGRLKHDHARRHPRKVVNLPVEISLYANGEILYDRGKAVLRNVSLSGALLGALVLPGMKMPAGPFTLGIRLLEGPLKDVEVRGRPVRLVHGEDALDLAMEFLGTEEAAARRLAAARA